MISVLYVDDESALLEIGKFFLEKTNQFRFLKKIRALGNAIPFIILTGLDRPGSFSDLVSKYSCPEIIYAV